MQQDSFFAEYQNLINPAPSKVRNRGGMATKAEPKTPKEKAEKIQKTRESKYMLYSNPCEDCPLVSYPKLLENKGNLATCKVLVILDRPSMRELGTKQPFSDPDAQFIEKTLEAAGIPRSEVAFINALRCACHDKELASKEIKHCGSYILRDIAASSCQAILCASPTAVRYMFDTKSLKAYRGRVLEFNKKQVVCCQTPDLVQRDPVQGSLFQNDIKRLIQVVSGSYTKPEYNYLSLTKPDDIVDICKFLASNREKHGVLGWDIETMWLEELEPYATDCFAPDFKIWHMSFAWSDFTAVGFPFHPDARLVQRLGLPSIESHPAILAVVRDVLENCPVVEHTKFDARCTAGRYQIEVAKNLPLQQFEDTHGMNFLINPEDLGGNKLKQLAWEYTTEGGYEDGIGFVATTEEYDWEKNIHYNCHDADITRRIRASLIPKVLEQRQDRVYEIILKPITCAVLHMELDGVQMNAPYLKEQQTARKVEMETTLSAFRQSEAAKQLVSFCAEKVVTLSAMPVPAVNGGRDHKAQIARYTIDNPAEPDITNDNLSILLYEVWKLPITKKTEGNEPSTDAEILEVHKKSYPILEQVLAFKKAQKLYGTYISPYLDGKWSTTKTPKLKSPPYIKSDGRVHPTIKPTGAATGRSSCENPNGQNIKNEYEALYPFTTRFAGGLLLKTDYSQAEIRIAACQCKDPVLSRALAFDIHTINLAVIEKVAHPSEALEALSGDEKETALFARCAEQQLAKMYAERVPDEKELKFYKKLRRTIAKKFMFGPMYGQTENGIVMQLVAELGVKEEEAKRDAPQFLAALRSLYKVYFDWAKTNIPEARRLNYVESIFGRRRPLNYATLLANTSKDDKEIRKQLGGLDRKVTNTKVQGPASDLTLLAGVHMVELFKNRRLTSRTEIKEKLLEDALQGKLYQACLAANLIDSATFESFIKKMLVGEVQTRAILPIHDAVVNDCPHEEVIPAAIIVDAVMVNVPKYYIETNGVPFSCELEIGPNLGELKLFAP